MIVVDKDIVVWFDVDDTLVMWSDDCTIPGDDKTRFEDPTDGSVVYLRPHDAHLKLIKKYKTQGYTVGVWSAAGWRWAKSVVKTLGLEDSVDLVMSKPIKYVDDLKASEILGNRVYIPFKHKPRHIEPGDIE